MAAGGDPMREAMTVRPANNAKLYFLDKDDEYWAICLFIEPMVAYDSSDTPELAYQGVRVLVSFKVCCRTSKVS